MRNNATFQESKSYPSSLPLQRQIRQCHLGILHSYAKSRFLATWRLRLSVTRVTGCGEIALDNVKSNSGQAHKIWPMLATRSPALA